MTGQEGESRTKRGLPYGDPLFRRSAYPACQWSRVDFCCDISLPKTGNKATDPAPCFRLLHSTAKLSPLVRWGLWALRWLCPAPPASSKEQDKSKCVISRSGHLDLRYSPPPQKPHEYGLSVARLDCSALDISTSILFSTKRIPVTLFGNRNFFYLIHCFANRSIYFFRSSSEIFNIDIAFSSEILALSIKFRIRVAVASARPSAQPFAITPSLKLHI